MQEERKKIEEYRIEKLRELYGRDGMGGIEKLTQRLKNDVAIYHVLDRIDEFKSDENLFHLILNEDKHLERIGCQLVIWKSRRDPDWINTLKQTLSSLSINNILKFCLSYTFCSNTS